MSDPPPAPFPHEQAVEAYGVRLALGASDRNLLARVAAVLPPCARQCEPSAVGARFGLVRGEAGYQVVGHGVGDLSSPDPEIATGLLDALVCSHVAQHAPDRVFVHAGVVAHRGRAILLPGLSMSGKSTLISELVGAGAAYYSDEYAVLDPDGMVHAYPTPLKLRTAGSEAPAESAGSVTGKEPVPAELVAVTSYTPGATWRPSRLSPAQAALALLSHTLVARERPEESLAAVTRVAARAVVLEGERGEASVTAPRLLTALDDRIAGDPPIPLA